jgi:hypothetical protein
VTLVAEKNSFQSMKKTCIRPILKSLDNILIDLVGMEKKTPSPKEIKKSAQVANQMPAPIPNNKVMLSVPQVMEALDKCSKG